jgi:hypothetical protein
MKTQKIEYKEWYNSKSCHTNVSTNNCISRLFYFGFGAGEIEKMRSFFKGVKEAELQLRSLPA